eukprot:g15289.t2
MLFSPADARRRLSDVFEHLQAIDRYLQTIDGCPGPSCAAEASLFSGLDYVRFDGRFATVEEGLDDVGVTMAPGQWPSPSPSAEPTATLQKLLKDALRAIQRFAQTGARYLLTNVHEGVDNFVGAQKTCHTTYIKYDYELPPFSLPKVVRVIEYQGLETSYTLFKLNSESQQEPGVVATSAFDFAGTDSGLERLHGLLPRPSSVDELQA